MKIIHTILIGVVVGLIARLLRSGWDSEGSVITTLLSIAGVMLAKSSDRPVS